MKGEFTKQMKRIFGTQEAYERSLPNRKWFQGANDLWFSKDRKQLDPDEE